jgi:hypothetical protein
MVFISKIGALGAAYSVFATQMVVFICFVYVYIRFKKEKIVHFGAKGYGHNYSPAARKSFRARHKCGEKKSKLSAQYWACRKLWAGPKGSKKACPEGRKCKY